MTLSEIPKTELREQLRAGVFSLRAGPFVYRIRTRLPSVIDGLARLYGDFPVARGTEFADFHVTVDRAGGWTQWFAPQAVIDVGGERPSAPVPLEHVFAVFEGCLNWCIYAQTQQFLIIHAAAVEGGGRAAILPAPPGSGKSTLCAALVNRGWRLLTDELTLIDCATALIAPLARPVSLKNDSVELIKKLAPGAVFGPVSPNTIKGTIAHMRPPAESVQRMDQRCPVGWLVAPRYSSGARLSCEPIPKARAFMLLAASSVNYMTLGLAAFEAVGAIIEKTECYELQYGDLTEAVRWFDDLRAPAPIP